MQPASAHSNDEAAQPLSRGRTRIAGLLILLLVLLLIAFLPPLVNVNRLQLRIARNISAAVGRPVHFDRVNLTLLPLPGFTLDNFVVDEDPAFGAEPILRSDQVRITLRILSLFTAHTEFSSISLTEPTSINLVRLSDGRWNIQSLLFQASHLQAAPTGQRFAGAAARFPYIQATGARVNLKLDQEKTPFSLSNADFALWLPEPHQWHLRVEATPIRTDTSPGDTGTLRAEGTLGSADVQSDTLAGTPINLSGDWRDAQLGGLGRLLFANDPGLRGDLSVNFAIAGTVGSNTITTDIQLAKARRADFVPDQLLALDASCTATAQDTFRSFPAIECHWPPPDSSDPSVLILTASLPDVRRPQTGSANLTLPALPAATFLDWLSVATPHPPTGFSGNGTLAGILHWRGTDSPPATTEPAPDLPASPAPTQPASAASTSNPVILSGGRSPQSKDPRISSAPQQLTTHTRQQETPNAPIPPAPIPIPLAWSGDLEFSGESLSLPALGPNPISLGDVLFRTTPPAAAPPTRGHRAPPAPPTAAAPTGFDLLPITLDLGGKQPAILSGHFDSSGYTLHLTGTAIPARLLALGNSVPQFGDGLAPLFTPAPTPAPVILSEGRSPQSKDPRISSESSPTTSASTPDAAANPPRHGRFSSAPGSDDGTTNASPDPTTPVTLDLTATRAWGGAQTWTRLTTAPQPKPLPHPHPHRASTAPATP